MSVVLYDIKRNIRCADGLEQKAESTMAHATTATNFPLPQAKLVYIELPVVVGSCWKVHRGDGTVIEMKRYHHVPERP